jgi:hypothetical protein
VIFGVGENVVSIVAPLSRCSNRLDKQVTQLKAHILIFSLATPLLILACYNVFASRADNNFPFFSKKKKIVCHLRIWLLPVYGAFICNRMMDNFRIEKGEAIDGSFFSIPKNAEADDDVDI